jgi:hypothetical protein
MEELEMPTDLTVTLAEDRPGAFSAIAEALGSAGVNIDGVAEIEDAVHVLVEDAPRAKQALAAAGLRVGPDQPVLVVEPANEPGALARITSALAESGVSVRFLYAATGTRIVIGVHDLERARAALPGS